MRIASLVPSGTDLVAHLGLAEHLVGVSHECDHPIAAGLPVLTETLIPSAPEAAPADVHEAVLEALADRSMLYVTDRERLAALEPDLVLGQTVCDVCAITAVHARAMLPPGAQLLTLNATSVDGLERDLRAVAAAAGIDAEAKIAAWRGELDAVPAADGSAAVLTLEWSDPPFVGGHWVPELVERAGGRNVLTEPGRHSRVVDPAAIEAEAIDLIVFMPCGYDLEAAAVEAASTPNAEHAAPLWATDANRLFSRCTPDSLLGGLRLLSALLRGESIDPTDARLIG